MKVFLETLDLEVYEELLDHLAWKANRVSQEGMESVEIQDLQGLKASLAFKVFLAFPETKERGDIRVLWVPRAIEDLMGLQEMTDPQDCQEYQAKWVPEAFQVLEDLVVCQDHLAFPEPRAAKEPKATRVHQDLQDHPAKLEVKVPLVLLVQLVHSAHQDKLVQEENLVCLAYQGQME